MNRFSELVDRARHEMDDVGVPGLALGVVSDDEEEAAGLGVTSLENPLEVTPDTFFQIGSITKTYTAAAVMRLVEHGNLSLDEPVRRYLPEFRLSNEDVAARVTLRHLLTHTGGWVGDVFVDTGAGEDALPRLLDRIAEMPQVTPLGELWAYCNSGFAIAGRVVEVVAGKPFEAALRELVLEPLGLERSFFFPADVMTHRFAVGHERDENDHTVVARPWWIGRCAHAEGGIVCSVGELLRYARFAFDGRPLLSSASWAEMTRAQVPIGGDFDAVGLAWMLRTVDGVSLISHDGGTKGQVARLLVAPEQRFAFAALTNHNYGGVVTDRLTEAVLEAYLGVREREPVARESSPAALAGYAGRYEGYMSDVELVSADGGLELRLAPKRGFPDENSPPGPPPPPAQLALEDDDWAFATDDLWKGTRVGFFRDEEGRIVRLRLGGRLYARA